jgi:purine-cytosine permease-like protein
MFYLVLGGTLALQYGVSNALIGAVLGVISYAGLGYLFARYAIATGNSSFLLSEFLFGSSGAALTSFIFFLTASYYAVFESTVVALAAGEVISALSYRIICIIIVTYSVLLVAAGVQRFLDKFNGILLIAYLIGLATTVTLSIHRYGYSDTWLHAAPQLGAGFTGAWACFMTYFGQQLLMMFTIDFARFGRVQDIRYHSLLAFGAPFYAVAFLLNALVGIFLAGAAHTTTVTDSIVMDTCIAILGGAVGLLFIWVTQTRINTANYFLASTNLQVFAARFLRTSIPRVLCAAFVGIIVLVSLLSANVIRYILVAVNYQAIILTAWVGVALSHVVKYHRDWDGAARSGVARPPVLHARGLLAWASSAIAGFCILEFGGRAAMLSTPASFVIAWFAYRSPPGVRAAPTPFKP